MAKHLLMEINIVSVLPQIILLAAGSLFLFAGKLPLKINRFLPSAALFIMAALLFFILLYHDSGLRGFSGILAWDNTAIIFYALIIAAALLAGIFSCERMRAEKRRGEYFFFLYLATAGMIFMVSAHDLIIVFFSMEILAVALYVLVGFFRTGQKEMEATVKYFLLGSFSSAFFLMGLALIYGAAGSTHLDDLYPVTMKSFDMLPLFYMGVIFVVAGLGFKIAAAPFHMWVPDVYEGAHSAVAAFLSCAPKIAAFAVIYRLGLLMELYAPETMAAIIIFMSVASMITGNLAALKQNTLIRMLAYSGIAQIGYVLIGVLTQAQGGAQAVTFYLFVYIFMNMGAFGIAVLLSHEKGRDVAIGDLAGLAKRRPFLAFAMTVFMISLAGIPPTGGFFAKLYIFKQGIETGYLWVVIIALVATVFSLFYYFRVVMTMYMQEEEGELHEKPRFAFLPMVLVFCAFVLLTCWLFSPYAINSMFIK